MIELADVTYRYPAATTKSLRSVNLSIKAGEVVCLTGPSGSGKTTVTRLVNGLVPHFYEGELSGDVEVCGLVPRARELWELAPKVASVFQNPKTQFFCLDTTGELAFASENLGVPPERIRKRVSDVTHALGLENLLGRNCLTLSGGEGQRVTCGCAAMLSPDVIVLDEPTSNLDFASMGLLRQIVRRWKREGRAVLVSEHRLHWLRDVSDRVVVMRDGSINREMSADTFFSMSKEEAASLGLRTPTLSALSDAPRPAPRPLTEPRIEVQGVRYDYPRSSKGISVDRITLRRGSVIALIGSNGAGKSTLARCLCGLAPRCRGTIDSGSGPENITSASRRGFLVMQDVSHQLFRETVLDEVLESMERPSRSRALSMLDMLDLNELADRHPLSLSGGQMQRVALASALASGRELLVLDEPTSGLDLGHMEQVAAGVTKAAAQGRAVVIVTHDPELIRACCTDFVHLERGSVVDAGPLDEDGWGRVLSFFEASFAKAEGGRTHG